ncbi:Riboflavin transporter FmnP [Halobacillus karajensis]|uniref:Riboflavin transporter n=1 Tax=Halobacillus karajensis TaxID=195088 RepID=A0A024P8U4_9BACI|nr:ECF transporter S component [Halobacillus karajensis]CDQ21374.1 Riboflavin ECF transporter S component FmnP [Halobacillus karajensis]CDQ25554.1 Riboflavin ECF transporter S component FmnP [Halobacillus karajensis]CDQ25825.1 Riboflavin ECF transporter S component FmnP [Halobacillus karajensis]SEI13728.1 Riboflavin transporter FmnP [Halobacillus karajensis]
MNPYTGQSSKLLKLIILALFGTISMVLMLLNFPLPLLPQYLKVDFSDVPALLAAILFTPAAGVVVEGVKNGIYLIYTGAADPIGVVANFFAGILFVFPAAVIYHKFRSVKSLITGLFLSSILMAVVMSVLNYFLILPAYSWFMGWESMSAQVKWVTILAGILPFNLIKGIVASALFVLLFGKMKAWIEQKSVNPSKAA